jgi:1-acyl-sn-glycerol-3-phosphate acyltransferase
VAAAVGIVEEVSERLQRVDVQFNRFGVDPFGISRRHLRVAFSFLGFFYRHYFRVHVHDLDRVPKQGRAMLVGNHSGGVALDAAMVMASLILELEPPRLAHSMVEKFLNRVPLMSQWTNRCGQFTGLPEHAVKLLEDDRMLLVFPEGARGTAKLYKERHSLVDFGTGFMRLALETRAPIVPFAFVGGGEAIPTIYNAYALGQALGAPYIPITPYLVAWPLPVRLDIVYGEPMRFDGDGSEDDEVIFGYVEEVKRTIVALMDRGKRIRRGKDGDPQLKETAP